MARAEITAVRTAVLALARAQRHATEVRADASVISQLVFPGLVRCASDCGSRRSDIGVAFAAWISAGVRLRMNTGCLRHTVLIA